MAEAARYMFDRTFEHPVRGSESRETAAGRQMREKWEHEMAEACCAAFEEGRAQGEAETLKGIEEATRAQTIRLIDSAQKLLDGVEHECNHIRHNAIELAAMTAKLLADELIARAPLLNLEALFTEALDHIDDAPHVALTVNDTLAESVQKSVTAIAAERGFAGKIVVLGDPETRKGDAALQWADGGITLDFESTRDAVSRILNRYLDRLNSQEPDHPAARPANRKSGPDSADEPARGRSPDTQPETETAPASGAGEPK